MDYTTNRRHLLFQILPLFFLVIAIVVGTLNIKAIRQLLIGALGQNANIVINTQTELGEMQRPWRNLAQGGEDKNWRITPQMATQLKALNVEYIRLDHIYDFYDIVSATGTSLQYDFTKLSTIIGDIRSAGAIPYISLSYIPPAIAVNGDITAPPADWNQWGEVVRKTIEHVSGTMNVPGVYYEVWNEPDLFGGYKVYGPKNYLQMYTAAATAAKRANVRQPFKFGGPAITALYKNWVDGVVKNALDQNLQFDFFSWHRYDRDINQYRQDISNVRQWLAPYPSKSNVELHITEWGHDPRNDEGYDNNFGAIHTLAVSTELEGNIDKAFVFEIQDSKDPAGKPRWGRWGIFDVTGQLKPRYSALRFLDQLGNTRLQLLGKGSWVKGVGSKDATGTPVILLVNYDETGRHSELTPVTFKNISPGSFQLDSQTFGGGLRSEKQATTGAEIRFNIPMSANSAVILKLRKL